MLKGFGVDITWRSRGSTTPSAASRLQSTNLELRFAP